MPEPISNSSHSVAPALNYRPFYTRPPPPIITVLLVTLALIPLSLFAVYPLALYSPYGWDTDAVVDVPTSHPANTGRPGEAACFTIVARGTGRGRLTRLTSVYINYNGHESPGSLEIDFTTMTCRPGLWALRFVPPRPLSRPCVLEHLQRAGFDPSSVEAQIIADQMLLELRKLAAGIVPPDRPYDGNTSGLYHYMDGTYIIMFGHLIWLPWYWPLSAVLWLLASILIARRFLRRYRERCLTV